MEAEFKDYEEHNKWKKIFKNLAQTKYNLNSKESRKPENDSLNRYINVVPYDETRVKLQRNGFDYINASHVNVPKANRKYILTQGPLKHTSGHFWLMIWEQKSRAILMLNNINECGVEKCYKYWPDSDPITFDDVKVKVEVKIKSQEFDSYILRTFTLTDLESNESREILQFHYTSWPDFDTPKSSDLFLKFLYDVRKSGCLDCEKYGPAVIHCSAGIGRSGTFVLVDLCLVMIEKNKHLNSINILDTLLELRKSRMGLIQTAEQLRFSFMAIIEGSKHLRLSCNKNKNMSKINRSFGMSEEKDISDQNIPNNDNDYDPDNDSKKMKTIEDCNEIESSNDQSLNNDNELRHRKNQEREENKRQRMEKINHIKRTMKESEERCLDETNNSNTSKKVRRSI